MPRVPTSLLRRARSIHSLLPLIVQECRDVESATRELRWLREGIRDLPVQFQSKTLIQWCHRRSRGEPLQYILGNQPFGLLDIKCRTGVLIPRPETETIVAQLCDAVKVLKPKARNAVDFCTGTGCIALFLAQVLKVSTKGFDISQQALNLANDNVARNATELKGQDVTFDELDVLETSKLSDDDIRASIGNVDVMVSNPPYISPDDFSCGQTTRSVRLYEPKLALVPPEKLTFEGIQQADQFYAALLRIAIATKAKVLMMEVGDTSQAERVLQMCTRLMDKLADQPYLIEIWNDNGEITMMSLPGKISVNARVDSNYHHRAVTLWLDSEWCRQREIDMAFI